MRRHSGVKLDRSLPPLIQSLKEGWASALQSSAAVSALFAGVSSQLYSFFTAISGDNSNYTRRQSSQGALTFMVLLSYATMLFNSGAAITSFVLVDSLSELPYQNAAFEEDPYPEKARVFKGPTFLLRRYGAGIKWDLALWHWLFCYFAGMWCLILQIVTYVLLQEPDIVRIPIACVAVFIVLPLIMYAIPRGVLRKIGLDHIADSTMQNVNSSDESTTTLVSYSPGQQENV